MYPNIIWRYEEDIEESIRTLHFFSLWRNRSKLQGSRFEEWNEYNQLHIAAKNQFRGPIIRATILISNDSNYEQLDVETILLMYSVLCIWN